MIPIEYRSSVINLKTVNGKRKRNKDAFNSCKKQFYVACSDWISIKITYLKFSGF